MSRLLKRLLGWALGLALLAWLLGAWAPQGGWALAQQTWQRMQAVPLGSWALGLLLWWSSFVWRAVRMRQEWRWRRTVSLRQALQVVLVHNAAVLLLPMRAGELGYPLLVRQVWSATWPQAMRSLLWLRLQDALVLALLAVCIWPGVPSAWRLAALGLAALGGGGLWWLARRGMGAPAWWRRGLLGRHRIGQVLRLLVQRRRSRGGWGLCLGNWLTKLLVVGGLLQALAGPSTGLTLLGAMGAGLGGELAALLPLQGPAGLGTYEAGVWLASGLGRGAAAELAAAALTVHLFCLAASLLAALLGGLPGLRRMRQMGRG